MNLIRATVVVFVLIFQLGVQAQRLASPVDFFYAPQQDAHQPIVDAIDSAKRSVKMVMYHLSDPTVGSALMFAAKRGVNVRVIFDKGEWKSANDTKLVNDMTNAGVQVVKATSAFSITHEKAMVIDDQRAMISTMNQIKTYMTMFDIGIFTTDQGVIQEWNQVFEADWQNAANGTGNTPELSNINLVWSPVNSVSKLVEVIDSARSRIELTVENLSYQDIQNALISAAGRGVAVRVIVPKCDVAKANFNFPAAMALRHSGADARMMPGPARTETPYIHAKTIVVDQGLVFLGSENFSMNSLTLAREVGIIAEDSDLANNVDSLFESLWEKSELPPADPNYKCAAFDFNLPSPTGAGVAPVSLTSPLSFMERLLIPIAQH